MMAVSLLGFRGNKAGQGLGSKMIKAALDDMRQQGYSTCWLRTEELKNVGLHEHLGFQQVYTEVPLASGQRYWLMFQDLEDSKIFFCQLNHARLTFDLGRRLIKNLKKLLCLQMNPRIVSRDG